MRPFEALLAGLLTLSAISLFISPVRRYRWAHLLPPSAILLTAVQLLLEGYRWQIVPLYCIAVVLMLVTAPNLKLVKTRQSDPNSKGSTLAAGLWRGGWIWSGLP